MSESRDHTNTLLAETMGMREMRNFRDNVERLRQERGWTMVELERRSKVSRTQIALVLSGEREITVKRAAMIADAFGLTLAEMIREDAGGAESEERLLTEFYRNSSPEAQSTILSMAKISAHDNERRRESQS